MLLLLLWKICTCLNSYLSSSDLLLGKCIVQGDLLVSLHNEIANSWQIFDLPLNPLVFVIDLLVRLHLRTLNLRRTAWLFWLSENLRGWLNLVWWNLCKRIDDHHYMIILNRWHFRTCRNHCDLFLQLIFKDDQVSLSFLRLIDRNLWLRDLSILQLVDIEVLRKRGDEFGRRRIEELSYNAILIHHFRCHNYDGVYRNLLGR